jgi:hypothetical protein
MGQTRKMGDKAMTHNETKGRWNYFLLTLGTAGLLAAPLLPGCAGTSGFDGSSDNLDPVGDSNNSGTSDDDDAPADQVSTTLTGVVRDAFGVPIGDVVVSTSNGATGSSDADGRFSIEDIEPGNRVLVDFQKTGYALSQTPFDILEDVENTLIQTLAVVDFTDTFDAADGLSFTVEEDGPTVVLPSSNFQDADGNAYAGSVTVDATFYDLMSEVDNGNELFATPGDFTAVDAGGDDQILESYGMLQVNLWSADGEKLELAGADSSIVMPLQDLGSADPPVVGTELAAWAYDIATGKWVEEAVGTVVDIDGALFWEFAAPHFSTWNCDRPISTHGCLTGIVTDVQGSPRSGATVRAVGITYISTTTARTAQDGSFCLEVKNGETVWAEISYSIAGQTATQRTDPVTIPGGTASCGLGTQTCVDLGEIPVDIQTCVSGVVVDSSNQGRANLQVVSPTGGISTTDASGAFCLTVPVFQTTEVYVLTEQDEIGYQPVRLYAQPGLPDCQGGCSNIAVLRPYSVTGCAEGDLVINGQVAPQMLVEVYDQAYSNVRVFSTLTSADGSFCAAIPGGTEVTVQVGSGDNLCDSADFSSQGLGGQECSDTTGQGECEAIGTLTCSL